MFKFLAFFALFAMALAMPGYLHAPVVATSYHHEPTVHVVHPILSTHRVIASPVISTHGLAYGSSYGLH